MQTSAVTLVPLNFNENNNNHMYGPIERESLTVIYEAGLSTKGQSVLIAGSSEASD